MAKNYARMGRNYEFLMRRTFNCTKGKPNGATREILTHLFDLEKKDKESVLYKRHFQKVQNYISRALCTLKKRKRYVNSQNEFMPLFFLLDRATCAEDLSKVAAKGLACIIKCENRLRESG